MDEQKLEAGTEQKAAPTEDLGIVSVNDRAGGANQTAARAIFLIVMAVVVVLGLVLAANTWHAKRKAEAANEEQAAKVENKPAQVGLKRVFETDPVLPLTRVTRFATNRSAVASVGPSGMGPAIETGTDEHGRLTALATGGGRGSGAATGKSAHSRFGGEAILANTHANGMTVPRTQLPGTGPEAAIALVRDLLASTKQADAVEPGNINMMSGPGLETVGAAPLPTGYGAGASEISPMGLTGVGLPAPPGPVASGAGPIGGLLAPSSTPKVQAEMLGDRNMILPKGRAIHCALTVRVVNEVAGMATCVLNADVYSDNGRVVLLERGSEAVGEYAATLAQGQRRLFLLWTRVKTPMGVVINLNSPAADALGTSGLTGDVDNHWWDRLGAAFLLSIVQDGIGFATASQAGSGGGQALSIYQHSAATGNRMAELILQSTINIKPTLYSNQGDRGTIFVARDLDFSTVYALHPH